MELKMIKKKLIQIGQWLIIILLAIFCFYLWNHNKDNKDIIEDLQYQKNQKEYVIVSNDKTLKELKKANTTLYDSIQKLSNVKEGIQIKYITHYGTDTVYIDNLKPTKDSVYHYSNTNDTINYELDIKAKEVHWFKLNFTMEDSLMIITRSQNGKNVTNITHSDQTVIKDATIYVPTKTLKEKIKDHIYFGVGIGAGYGFFNQKPDVYLGVSVGYKF